MLFLGAFGWRRQPEIEVAGFQRVFVVPQRRIVGRHRHGKAGRQRFVHEAGAFELHRRAQFDINAHNWHQKLIRPNVRYVPIATDAPRQTASLFDYLVGAGEHSAETKSQGAAANVEIALTGIHLGLASTDFHHF
jgi:hypothetical protein